MSTPVVPEPLGAVTVPKFLSPSRFGELMNCRLSVLAPAQTGECQDRCRVSGGQLFRSTARWSGFSRTTAMGFQLRV